MNHFHPRPFRSMILAAALLLLGAGCAKAPATTGEAPAAPAAQQQPQAAAPAPAPAATSLCEHPYYPLKKGYAVSYATTFAGQPSGSMTMRVVDSTRSGAKLTFEFEQGFTSDQTIDCDDGTLKADAYINAGGAQSSFKMQTKRTTGILMPKDVGVGSVWEDGYEVLMTSDDPKLAQFAREGISGTVASKKTVLGEESVTVPAGTFTALKVNEETTTTMVIPGLPFAPPPTVTSATAWYAKGVGLVKQESETPAGLSVTVATQVTRP